MASKSTLGMGLVGLGNLGTMGQGIWVVIIFLRRQRLRLESGPGMLGLEIRVDTIAVVVEDSLYHGYIIIYCPDILPAWMGAEEIISVGDIV